MKRLLQALVWIGLVLVGSSAHAQTIDTFDAWNGSQDVGTFGVEDTATYGQTIVVPPGAQPLTGFQFRIGQCTDAVTFQGYIFEWDTGNSRATGPSLYESAVMEVASSPAFHLVTFDTGSLILPAGTYVLFASTSDHQGGGDVSCNWGVVSDSAYGNGTFVFINNGPDASRWTTDAWDTFQGVDLAFRAAFGEPVPTMSQWMLIVMTAGLLLAGALTLRMRRRSSPVG